MVNPEAERLREQLISRASAMSAWLMTIESNLKTKIYKFFSFEPREFEERLQRVPPPASPAQARLPKEIFRSVHCHLSVPCEARPYPWKQLLTRADSM